jgi:hypothetical protein
METADVFLDQEFERLSKKTGITLPDCKCYCGVEWMPRWFRVLLSEKFNKSCKIHDVYYESELISNIDADFIFLEHMYMQAGKSLYWKVIAYMMFLNVRVFQFFASGFVSFFKE